MWTEYLISRADAVLQFCRFVVIIFSLVSLLCAMGIADSAQEWMCLRGEELKVYKEHRKFLKKLLVFSLSCVLASAIVFVVLPDSKEIRQIKQRVEAPKGR